jgi:hypothetical protein
MGLLLASFCFGQSDEVARRNYLAPGHILPLAGFAGRFHPLIAVANFKENGRCVDTQGC